MPKIHSIIMPYFRMDVPPLSIACLSAHLKKHNIDLSCTDFRLLKNDVQTFTCLGYRDNYVMDIPDLPLILAVIKNYRGNRPLLDDMDKVIEDYIRPRPLSFFRLKKDIADIYRIITDHLRTLLDYDIISFTTYEANFLFVIICSLLLREKKPDIKIIYGGPQVTQSENSSKLVLKLGLADAVVLGEGEKTLLDIMKALSSGKSSAVKGTMTYDANKDVFIRQPADPLDIDTLPCPDFSSLDLNGYPRKKSVLPLYTSRGCPFKCAFCNEWETWHPFRQLKPDRVVEWMRTLNDNYGTFRFYFADSLLNASRPWLEEFADTLMGHKLNFEWYGYFRAKMSTKLAEKLKKGGLCRAFIGAESFSQTRLQGMNKKSTVTDNLEAVEAFCSCNIPLEISTIVGFPHESESDFQKSRDFYLDAIKKYPRNVVTNFESFQLRPSTKIYRNLKDFGLSVTKWGPDIIKMVPEVIDIVSSIDMSVKGKPKPEQIIERMNIMRHSFLLDNDTETKARVEFAKEFLKTELKHIKPANKVILTTPNVSVADVESESPLIKGVFLLRWEKEKHLITEEEKAMLDRFDGKVPISDIVEELSLKFKKEKDECSKEILIFLNDLLERDILFDISS